MVWALFGVPVPCQPLINGSRLQDCDEMSWATRRCIGLMCVCELTQQ
jgi:hypothetical protein